VTAHTHARHEPGCYRCELGADEAREAEADARREARDALVAGYRVRVILEIRHADRAVHLTGATFTHERAELAAAVPGLLGVMLPRVLAMLDPGPDA
jgi:hypothetical protein